MLRQKGHVRNASYHCETQNMFVFDAQNWNSSIHVKQPCSVLTMRKQPRIKIQPNRPSYLPINKKKNIGIIHGEVILPSRHDSDLLERAMRDW
jgi:hypothetical protein